MTSHDSQDVSVPVLPLAPDALALAASPSVPPPLPTKETWKQERRLASPSPTVDSHRVTGEDFLHANRIHVDGGSIFEGPYLIVHPRELDPKNEAALQKKLATTFSLRQPSFYQRAQEGGIAARLAELIPVNLQAQRDAELQKIEELNKSIAAGGDLKARQAAQDRQDPLGALIRSVQEDVPLDPVSREAGKHGLMLFLLIEERLAHPLPNSDGTPAIPYVGGMLQLVRHSAASDQILADLANPLGIAPEAFREAASQGPEAVGTLLKLDPALVAQVKAVADDVADHDFSFYRLQAWKAGRALAPQGSVAQQCEAGMSPLIAQTIAKFRQGRHGSFDVPETIRNEEALFAKRFAMLDPQQRRAAWLLGYEYGYTPEVRADAISGHAGIYGLNSHITNRPSDIFPGIRHIYVSGKELDGMGSDETFCHENTHIFFPQYLTPEQQELTRTCLASDAERFEILHEWLHDSRRSSELEALFDQYKRDLQSEQAQQPPQHYVIHDHKGRVLHMETIFPHLENFEELRHLVDLGHQSFRVNGERYTKSQGYHTPESRLHEVFARYGAARQVRYPSGRSRALLNAVAPGLDTFWNKAYLPHLTTLCDAIEAGRAPLQGVVDEANARAPNPSAALAEPSVDKVREPIRNVEPGVHEGLADSMAMAAAQNIGHTAEWLGKPVLGKPMKANPTENLLASCAHGQRCCCVAGEARPNRAGIAGKSVAYEGALADAPAMGIRQPQAS